MDDYKIGLKIWSINKEYFQPAQILISEGYCDFLEIYYVPGSSADYVSLWKKIDAPIFVHAPHYSHRVNLSLREFEEGNRKSLDEAITFAKRLDARGAIIHGGTGGTIDELIRQISRFDRNTLIIENKPVCGLNDAFCVGVTPEDIKTILDELGMRFCLDISHAIIAANTLGIDALELIDSFISLGPTLYHLCDSYTDGNVDHHLNIGDGDYDFPALLSHIPKDAWITLETPKNKKPGLLDVIDDVQLLRHLCGHE
ncbi:MAG: TIM barrel protein [Deltaproteobacteria bacterium]|nr:TIM barrel protein [Candidatus Zymogenaceae bacterium]